ncbi:hypothetical protein [Nocardia rhizosphaerae]|uniref:Uncharacterized protein n=1 Tax=Nocardia rhizosphaerae TaxID=1691571 RepID=A0ABV8LFE1_9NOCA
MTADVPDLTIAELEQIREATLRTYEGGDEQYDTLPRRLRELTVPDGGLINMIDLAILRTRQLEALRAQTQEDYAAIRAKQQRDAERIRELEVTLPAGEWVFTAADVEAAKPTGGGVDYTIVAPGALAKMLADDENTMSPRFREAIARARQRRENPDG